IGYGFAHDQLISNLMKVKLPFEPSSLAQAAGLAALEDNYHIEKTVQLTQDGIEYFSRELRRLEVNTIPSAANFITTKFSSEKKAGDICQQMLEEGVILRHLKPFGWPDYIRISMGLLEENETCLNVFRKVL
ncbi:MAG TPA: aminotransferase class I/II-fold pyridoxal phosphate-dependent enzyme, partial [Candidatus Marinimicrobia bacterium]|nr:aminotransferase class I/II-fold pyridoxal phosphate-dependent enzyme [Candidatus Neomarinimicrobiota bacterium]